MAACEHLIRQHRVAVIPGSAFGDNAGCSIRISYGALGADSVSEGVRRLVGGIQDLARLRAAE
jgi:aspartate/methionine/tyrosine aminotransferase